MGGGALLWLILRRQQSPAVATPQEMVREFTKVFGCKSLEWPTQYPGVETVKLRWKLMHEEWCELQDAMDNDDLILVADGLGDLLYVVYGTAEAYGINLDEVVAEIHRSNMSKVGPFGTVQYREDGKVLKGPEYFEPQILEVLQGQGLA